ncbi:hypothetical protein [Winogradskyella sp. R77965]|uniref:FEKKY domain-containing protein n=1 Tax=Winogradskyella sp. R77965 TaxID=3093872 RepID=UPI0037DCE7DE
MKKSLTHILFALVIFSCDESEPKFEIDFNGYTPVSLFNANTAKNHIERAEIKIIFLGGFGGMPDFSNKKDSIFQKKYKVNFYSEGCMRSSCEEDMLIYNNIVFNYLDSRFGANWRKEMRDGAIGL